MDMLVRKMMKIKTSEATGCRLDYLVAIAEGVNPKSIKLPHKKESEKYKRLYRWMRDEDGNLTGSYMTGPEFLYSKMWESGGPIIEREEICLGIDSDDGGKEWEAQPAWYGKKRFGPTPLIAAMRCFVASKLGEEVDVPDELCKA